MVRMGLFDRDVAHSVVELEIELLLDPVGDERDADMRLDPSL